MQKSKHWQREIPTSKLIADKKRDKTVFDNSQRNLIVNFAYKLDDRAATKELANNLAAAVAAENTEEINRLMWEAEEKIESLPDGMIGLSEMHEYGYLNESVRSLFSVWLIWDSIFLQNRSTLIF